MRCVPDLDPHLNDAGLLMLEPPSMVAGWVAGLPRLLWDLGDRAPASSAAALRMLHDVARCCSGVSGDGDGGAVHTSGSGVLCHHDQRHRLRTAMLAGTLRSLQPQLVPLLGVVLPPPPLPRATAKGGKGARPGGPCDAATSSGRGPPAAPPASLPSWRPGPLPRLPDHPHHTLFIDALQHIAGDLWRWGGGGGCEGGGPI
jgi:pre-rRNA-processing protein IPI1